MLDVGVKVGTGNLNMGPLGLRKAPVLEFQGSKLQLGGDPL